METSASFEARSAPSLLPDRQPIEQATAYAHECCVLPRRITNAELLDFRPWPNAHALSMRRAAWQTNSEIDSWGEAPHPTWQLIETIFTERPLSH